MCTGYAQAFGVGFEEAGRELGLQARTAYRLKAVLAASDELQALIRDHAIAAKPADLLVKVEATNKRRALRLAEQYAAGAVGLAELETDARRAAPAKRPAATGKDIELRVDEQQLRLSAHVIFERITDEQRQRLAQALGVVLRKVGIGRVEAAESTLS